MALRVLDTLAAHLGWPAAGLSLDRVDRANALERRLGDRSRTGRVVRADVPEAAPCMSPASGFEDIAFRVDLAVPASRVSLQDAWVAREVCLWMLALAAGE
jgi:hypothetical protein